jgi:uncharacterized RmlC-like cupin family protein
MSDPVRVVRGGELAPADPTPGMRRERAFETDGMWTGVVRTEPGATSGWHHHGDHDTTIYLVDGAMRLEFGPGGGQAVDAGPGDFVLVPKHTVHREANPTDGRSTAVVVRAGTGPPTVNVDGPEPG